MALKYTLIVILLFLFYIPAYIHHDRGNINYSTVYTLVMCTLYDYNITNTTSGFLQHENNIHFTYLESKLKIYMHIFIFEYAHA